MFVDETTVEQEYSKGFDCGYTWLTKGWNFLHPKGIFVDANGHSTRGYIPGGPLYIPRAHTWEYIKIREEQHKVHALSKAWHSGWIDGINKYVRENNLDYPQLSKEGI